MELVLISRDWGLSDHEYRIAQALWVLRAKGGHASGGDLVDSEIARDVDDPRRREEILWDATEHLEKSGVIEASLVLDFRSCEFALTHAGHRAAEEIYRRQTSRVRKAACQDALLHWLAEQDDQGLKMLTLERLLDAPQARFLNDRFQLMEADAAAGRLAEDVLVDARGSFGRKAVRLEITSAGLSLVERQESVSDFRARSDGAIGTTTSITVSGTGNTVAPVVGSTNVSQTVTTTSDNSAHGTRLRENADSVQALQGVPGVTDDLRHEIADLAEVLRAGADRPSSEAPGLFDRAKALAEKFAVALPDKLAELAAQGVLTQITAATTALPGLFPGN
jgi:hypothetical protein